MVRSLEEKYRFPGNRFSGRMLRGKLGFLVQKTIVSNKRTESLDTVLVPVVKKGTKGQRKATKEVHKAVYDYMKFAISDLKNNQKRGQTWFGESHIDYAIHVLENMKEILRKDKIKYVFGGKYRDDDTYAYSFKETRKLFLCKKYQKAKRLSGYDTRMGILTHELSHALSKTDDKVYGISACKQLANSTPRRASRNADNYEYFVETISLENL